MKTYSVAALLGGATIAMIGACAAGAKSNGSWGGNGGDSSTSVASTGSGGSGGGVPTTTSSASAAVTSSGAGSGSNPGSCKITCVNDAPNHEMGCDGCLKSACPSEYAACAADLGDAGCVSCAELLAPPGGNGIDCDESVPLMTQLLNCACAVGVCD